MPVFKQCSPKSVSFRFTLLSLVTVLCWTDCMYVCICKNINVRANERMSVSLLYMSVSGLLYSVLLFCALLKHTLNVEVGCIGSNLPLQAFFLL